MGGTLPIINHTKNVHEKYAEKDQAIASEAADANDQHRAYLQERSAYTNEAAAVRAYRTDIKTNAVPDKGRYDYNAAFDTQNRWRPIGSRFSASSPRCSGR